MRRGYADGVGSFHDFALTCQSLGQTSSRLQIAELAGEFLARLEPAEAEIAARFMVGQALPQGHEQRLQVSGRAIWRIAAALAGDDDGGEEIFAAATDFGEAVEILLRRRPNDPQPTLAINEVAHSFERIAAIEGRNSRRRKLDELRDLFVRASALEGKYLAKILIREMRHGMSDGLMLEAISRMSNRPVAEIRRAHMLETDLGRVVRLMRSARVDAPGPLPGSVAVALQPGATADRSAGQAGRPAIVEPAPAGSEDQALSLAAPDARPIRPMLAAPAPRIADAFEILGPGLALE
ncbi:MAG TPA: hypothetical protein VJN94_06605, partial [Candidatus Binataceae bacterium]|nr:hypothetical protein [Candidatus Binataceae bacterium]